MVENKHQIVEKWSDLTFFEKLFFRTAQLFMPVMVLVFILAILYYTDVVFLEKPVFLAIFFAPIAWYIFIFKIGRISRKRRLKKAGLWVEEEE